MRYCFSLSNHNHHLFFTANADCDFVGLSIRLTSDDVDENGVLIKPIYLSPRLVSQLHSDVILELFEIVCQSNEKFALARELRVEIDRCLLSRGGSRTDLKGLSLDHKRKLIKKRSIHAPDDFMIEGEKNCLAIVIALALALKNTTQGIPYKSRLKLRFESFRTEILYEVSKLNHLTGFDLNNLNHLAGVKEFEAYQDILKAYVFGRDEDRCKKFYRLVIYESDGKSVFSGKLPDGSERKDENSKNIQCDFQHEGVDVHVLSILLYNNHFYVIKSLTGVFASDFCLYCNRQYNRKFSHKCDNICECCRSSPPCLKTQNVTKSQETKCNACYRTFFTTTCYANHLKKKAFVCRTIRNCKHCLRFINGKKHVCGEAFCSTCCAHKPVNHVCFIPYYTPKLQNNRENKKEKKRAYCFFDFETLIVKTNEGNVHYPNLSVSQIVCDDCNSDEKVNLDSYHCSTCGERERIFKMEGSNLNSVTDAFIRYLITIQDKLHVTVIEHNASGFAYLFILRRFYAICPEAAINVVVQGTRIYAIHFKNLRMVDSFLYTQTSLSKLPKFCVDIKKGTFHIFSIRLRIGLMMVRCRMHYTLSLKACTRQTRFYSRNGTRQLLVLISIFNVN